MIFASILNANGASLDNLVMDMAMLRSIKGKKIFAEIFTGSKKLNSDSGYCFVVFDKNYDNLADSDKDLNYAVIVKKKTAKKAVSRNRAKRLMREVLRQSLPEIQTKEYYKAIKYIVFYWAKPMPAPKLLRYHEVENTIAHLLEKVESYFETKIKVVRIEELNKITD